MSTAQSRSFLKAGGTLATSTGTIRLPIAADHGCAVEELLPVGAKVVAERLKHLEGVLPNALRIFEDRRQIPTEAITVSFYC